MLSKEHAIVHYDWQRQRVVPDRLTQQRHGQYRQHAERMLAIYREGIGRTRRSLHRQVENILADEEECPARRIHALCKLLDDVSTYQQDTAGRAAKLRREVFRQAAASHPLVAVADGLFEHQEDAVKDEIAAKLGTSWEAIDAELFADVFDFQRLQAFAGYPSGEALLARYNVAQVQVVLFDALSLTLRVQSDLKRILRQIKLARLMHTLRRRPDHSYEIQIDGPASVLRGTRRYGVAMAKFLPTLLACRDWMLHARLRGTNRTELALRLSPADRLNSHLVETAEFDSELERRFSQRWGDEPRDGWTLHREAVVLHQGQKTFVPDFEFRHMSGRSMLMELIGFWTPEYLAAKQQTLEAFRETPILLALPHDAVWPDSPTTPLIRYKTVIRVEEVLAALNQQLAEDAR
jgi:hypothetical protein